MAAIARAGKADDVDFDASCNLAPYSDLPAFVNPSPNCLTHTATFVHTQAFTYAEICNCDPRFGWESSDSDDYTR